MKTNTRERIFSFIKEKGEVTPKEIIQFIDLGAPAVFRQLKKLQEESKITKIGKPPRVFYSSIKEKKIQINYNIDKKLENTIEKEYITITNQGKMLKGITGFEYWCNKQNLDVKKTSKEYINTLNKYNHYKKNNLIDGRDKMEKTFDKVYLDEIYYLDFYSIERFGKTKLGQLILYAKQTQNKKLIQMVNDIIKEKVLDIIQKNKINATGFIPPTIPRKIQFQKEIKNLLNIPTQGINIIKVTNEIPIPQKSLSKIEDRIQNARNTIFIKENNTFKNILLIDDAIGSGATLNETAKKLKEKKISTGKIIGLAIVGSFKGFEVIQEI
jgi:hypothetical protein